MKTVGILGGMGPFATHAFYGHLIQQTAARSDQAHLHVVMDANSAIPDRTAFLVDAGEDPRPALISAARALRILGADFAVIPCNTASAFIDDIVAGSGLPFISWIEVAADAVRESGYQTVGLLATTGTVRTRLYQEALAERGVRVLLPESHDQELLMDVIYGEASVKTQGFAGESAKSDLVRVASKLVREGAMSLLLGCTELPLTISANSSRWPVSAVDPAVHVARCAVTMAGADVTSSST
jgi:aspartate racemase